MLGRDRLGELFEDEQFARWYPVNGCPALSAAQLALVSVLQFRRTSPTGRPRTRSGCGSTSSTPWAWRLEDTGFDYSVLSEFRARLAEEDRADRLLQLMLDRLVAAGLLKGRGRPRTDATHVLAAVRRLSRLKLAGESVRAALEQLAAADPQWLLPLIEPAWAKRYGRKVEIGQVPGGKAAVRKRAEEFGRDGQKLLTAAWAADAPPRLRTLPQAEILRQIWVHQYYWAADGRLRWRKGTALPPASLRFDSPYDPDARYCVKRDTDWSGYRVHFTETCDKDLPHLVVHVATTIAPVQDGQLTETIHDDLAARDLAPGEHVVDTAYLCPAQIERAQRVHGITLLGPIPLDHSRQAKAGAGFDKSAFAVDWDRQQATCPQGTTSRSWGPLRINGIDYIQVRFDQATCRACPVRAQCTTSADRPRALALLPQPLHDIQMRARAEQATEQWQQRYAIRAGIEATLSQTVRTCGLRRTRYRGLARTHVQHVPTAMARNLDRLADWFAATPTAPRRASHYQRLCTAAGHATA